MDGSKVWPEIRKQWSDIQKEQGPEFQRLTSLYDLVRPHLLDAIRRVGLSYSYLLPEGDLPLMLLARIGGSATLPEKEQVFEIQMDSVILRFAKDRKQTDLCDLRDPLAPWVEFCRRVNSLRRSYRRYFLTFLPRVLCGQVQHCSTSNTPSWKWAKLWDSLAQGIPAASLPNEWCQVRKALKKPVPSIAQSDEIFVPSILRPQQVWQETLAKPLFQAALYVESRRPAWIRFPSCPGLMPTSAGKHAKNLKEALSRFGGIPSGDRSLEELIRGVLAWEGGEVAPVEMDSVALTLAAKEFHYKPFDIEALLGSIHERNSHALEANRHFQRGLAEANCPYDISTALSNLAARAFMAGDLQKALKWARESLLYDATNEMARWNLGAIQQSIQDQFRDFGTHG